MLYRILWKSGQFQFHNLLPLYLLTPCSRDLLEKLTSFRPVKKFADFYGTRRFITAFTSARVQFRCFVTRYVLRWWVVSNSPNHKFGGPPLVGCSRLLIRSIPQLPSIMLDLPPSSTWRSAMAWWHGHFYHGNKSVNLIIYIYVR